MTWQHVTIDEATKQIKTGGTPSTARRELFGGSVPWFTPSDVGVSRLLNASSRSLTQAAIDEGKAPLFEPGMLLVTCIGDIGRVGILQRASSANQQITALKFRDGIDVNFAYYWFLLNQYEVERLASQAVVPILNNARLRELKFSYPSPLEQKRLVAILAKADRLRRLRRYALTVSDTYLQTVFLEMFGDPAKNTKGWEVRKLGQHLTFLTSGSRGWAEYYADSGELFLRIQNIGKGQLLLNDIAYVQAPDNAESRRTKVQAGDLIFSITADLGRVAVIPEKFPAAYINQHLALLRLKDVEPIFMAHYFTTSRGHAQIIRLDREGVKSGLNFDDIRGLEFFLPPLSLQQKFDQIVQKHERLRAQQREAVRQAEGLFQVLLHRAFRGELSGERELV